MDAIRMRNPAQLMFLFTATVLAYLVLPPFFFILHTSLVTDRGLQAGSFTIQHFANIIESLGDVKTLLVNSLIYSFGSSAVALIYGTTLAWFAERSDAPFRQLSYISAYVSFAIPGIIKVVGWIMVLGPKAGHSECPVYRLHRRAVVQYLFDGRDDFSRKLLVDTDRIFADVDAFPFHGSVP